MENVFIVEKILQKRRKKAKIEYLVKWRDFNNRHNSWIPKDNILDQRLIDAFETQNSDCKVEETPPEPIMSVPSRRTSRRSRGLEPEVSENCENVQTPTPETTSDSNLIVDSSIDTSMDSDESEIDNKSPPAPTLIPMVSESELWMIQERNKIQQTSANSDWCDYPIVITDVKVRDINVIFKESKTPDGFFGAANIVSPSNKKK